MENVIKYAIIAKAIRFLVLPESPFGLAGEVSEYGQVSIRPDHSIREMLFGCLYADIDVDTITVTEDEVVLAAFGVDAATQFPESKLPQVALAIESAKHWVANYIAGVGVA